MLIAAEQASYSLREAARASADFSAPMLFLIYLSAHRSEVLHLPIAAGVLTVRKIEFCANRFVPVGSDLACVSREYIALIHHPRTGCGESRAYL